MAYQTRLMKCFWMLTSTTPSHGGQMPWIQKIQQVTHNNNIIVIINKEYACVHLICANDNIMQYIMCCFPDVIMDMLGSEEERMAILNYYQESDEPQAVENAIEEVCNSVDDENIQQR